MPAQDSLPLMVVDVGNSRIKFGAFEHPLAEALPHPTRAVAVRHDWQDADLEAFMPSGPSAFVWSIASVNRPASERLVQWLAGRGVQRVQLMSHADLPLAVDLPLPGKVGIDRLANAVAVNRLRHASAPALIVDMGTAIKVDMVSASGAFAGGTIMPGIAMSARALHEFTDLLPLVTVNEPPAALGTSTLQAISSGLYWGAIGAVRELISRLAPEAANRQAFLTGGDAADFAAALADVTNPPVAFVPHLTLAGIALAAQDHWRDEVSR